MSDRFSCCSHVQNVDAEKSAVYYSKESCDLKYFQTINYLGKVNRLGTTFLSPVKSDSIGMWTEEIVRKGSEIFYPKL